MRLPFRFAFGLKTGLVALGVSAFVALPLACGDDDTTPDDDGPTTPVLKPGDICTKPAPNLVRARFSPSQVFVPACAAADATCLSRKVRVVIEPDVCDQTPVTFESSDPNSMPAPAAGTVTLYQNEIEIEVHGSKDPGRYSYTAKVPKGTGEDASATLDIVVLDDKVPACSGTADDSSLTEGETLAGSGELQGASIGLPKGANKPNSGSYLWSVEPFNATLECGNLDMPEGHIPLGPAITFGPEDLKFQREIPLSIPVNPALVPAKGRFRHVRVLYSGPAFKEPRVVPIADPRFVASGDKWALSFKAPRLGTYQAVIQEGAGERTYKRKLTHRAVIGVSMGGMGSSMFGLRHHDKFDVVAPLGGPASWSWLIHYIEQNHLAGFRPIAPGTIIDDIPLTRTPCDTTAECEADEQCLGKTDAQQGKCTFMQLPTDPYEHNQVFNNWWAEYPRTGTGGRFPRDEYAQIFRDLALLMGNPNGDNLAPNGENLPPGVPPNDKSVLGEHDNGECRVWVDPLPFIEKKCPPEADADDECGCDPEADEDDECGPAGDCEPDPEHQGKFLCVNVQAAIADSCPIERCANTLTLNNYYDDQFNPDGTFPVITVCDGTEPDEAQSPWANAWAPEPNNYPLEVALAVDYNGNGVRDELEPIVQSGREPWVDTGEDGELSVDEPGYQLGVDEDPSGDDYQLQYNPGGTEHDYRYQLGEVFDDFGMDGVDGTPQQPAGGALQPGDGYDVGEGDGVFTASRGLKRMWNHDPAAMIRNEAEDLPGGPMDQAALDRLDLWTDGGTRDLFNFHVSAQTMIGGMAARGRDTQYYTSFAEMPGYDPTQPNTYTPALMPWEDVAGAVMMRYGAVDPTAADIENGSGQHVGTVNEITSRLQTGLYFIGSRWKEPSLRTVVKVSNDNPAPNQDVCVIDGSCTFEFTDSRGRKGPVTVNFPPGYAHVEQQDRRYPVIFMLHGYGQTPEDLGAAIIFINNWMNNPGDSATSRMPKSILVYVDGRCRTDENGKAECIRGNFFTDSGREEGMKAEAWWLELMTEIDNRYRTMGSTETDWEE